MQSPVALALDNFCFRQFDDPKYSGSRITGISKSAFEQRINEFYLAAGGEAALKPGYAPFCKHLFVPNFTDAVISVAPITRENEHLLKSGYEARKDGELAVLSRWFPKEAMPERKASHLDIILYSRDQITKENIAMGFTPPETDAPWGIISVKAQDRDSELPMNPITVMRNALGEAEGGSGMPLDREAYNESVEYWAKHAVVK